jgi:hypothetical protein
MNLITTVAGVVTPIGKTATDKKLSVVHQASSEAMLALSALPGKVGQAARAGNLVEGLSRIVNAAANANYKPIADYIGAQTGLPVCISSRASFEALPDRFQEALQVAKSAKNGGWSADGTKMGAKLAMATVLLSFTREAVLQVAKIHEARRAARDERLAEESHADSVLAQLFADVANLAGPAPEVKAPIDLSTLEVAPF